MAVGYTFASDGHGGDARPGTVRNSSSQRRQGNSGELSCFGQRSTTAHQKARAEGAPRDLALPDKPSIAVVPFQNLSGDPAQDYFADGMVEDIITGLSRIKWLFVIARNSTFAYKGQPIDVKGVGRELGVRYVLEGSVRKSASRVRIIGQLIDTSTGAHISADRFDGAIEDIFDLQDQVTASVVGAIAPKIEQAEIERARRKPTASLDAYDYYLQGMAKVYQATKNANGDALRLFYKAVELDPNFASAYGMAAWCYAWRKFHRWMADRVEESEEAARLALQAVELGKNDATALTMVGSHSHSWWVRSRMEPLSSTTLSCSIRTWQPAGC
jgi:TolB-like protein